MHLAQQFFRMLTDEMEESLAIVEVNAGMCRMLDDWDRKLKKWEDAKILNHNGVVEVTAKSVQNFLDFRPETSYMKRWLSMDAIVAYGKLFESGKVTIIESYPIQKHI